MNWLTDFVRPKIRSLLGQREIPENLWTKCSKCLQMVFNRNLSDNLFICPHCEHHFPVTAHDRIKMIYDEESYRIIRVTSSPDDPLRFRDLKRYSDRLKEHRQATQMEDALLVACGKLGGIEAIIVAFDFRFIGGSMGVAVGTGFLKACEEAVALKIPLIVFTASGGARMQEGPLSLMQMPRTLAGVQLLKKNKLPYIVVATHPTTGGVVASFAALGDVMWAEPGAIIGFTGSRVIQETMRLTLPEGFQSSEFQEAHGFLDGIIPRKALRQRLINLLTIFQADRKKFSDQAISSHVDKA